MSEVHNIGTPGGVVRMSVTHSGHDPADTLQPGEVIVVTATAPTTKMMISADGKSLVAYVPTLAEQQQAMWERTKRIRMVAYNGGCNTAKGRVQTDAFSRQAIGDAARQAQLSPLTSITWTMMDGSDVVHSAADIIAASLAVQQRHAACHAVSRNYHAAIMATTTVAALNAIDVTLNWPD